MGKALARLPVSVGVGLVGVSTGIAVAVGGCGIEGSNKNSSGALCRASVQLAGKMIESSLDLVGYIMKPDLRHWRKLPEGFLITNTTYDACMSGNAVGYRSVRSFVE